MIYVNVVVQRESRIQLEFSLLTKQHLTNTRRSATHQSTLKSILFKVANSGTFSKNYSYNNSEYP